MEPITYSDYWNQINDHAKNILDENNITTEDELRENDDIWDSIHETVDGDSWLIYYYYHPQILQHTKNGDALEEYGFEGFNTVDEILAASAFWAMHHDISDAINDFDFDELEEAA